MFNLGNKFSKILAAGAVTLALGGATAAMANDYQVRIINNTRYALTELYATNTRDNDWGEDLLGDHVIESHDSETVDLDDGSERCWYDLRAVFSDGKEIIHKHMNVCSTTSLRFY